MEQVKDLELQVKALENETARLQEELMHATNNYTYWKKSAYDWKRLYESEVARRVALARSKPRGHYA